MANVIFWPELPNDLPRPKLSAIELLNVNWFIEQHFFIVLHRQWANSVMPGLNKRKNYHTRCFTHTHCRQLLWQSHYLCQLQKNYRNALGMWIECHAFRPITIIYKFIFLPSFHQKLNVRHIKNVNNRIDLQIGFLASMPIFVIQIGEKTQNSSLALHFIFLYFGEFSGDFPRRNVLQYKIC